MQKLLSHHSFLLFLHIFPLKFTLETFHSRKQWLGRFESHKTTSSILKNGINYPSYLYLTLTTVKSKNSFWYVFPQEGHALFYIRNQLIRKLVLGRPKIKTIFLELKYSFLYCAAFKRNQTLNCVIELIYIYINLSRQIFYMPNVLLEHYCPFLYFLSLLKIRNYLRKFKN